MNLSRRSWLSLLIVAGLLLTSVAPVFAQDQEPSLPDGNSFLFLPSLGNSAVTADAGSDAALPVTRLNVPAEGVQVAAAASYQRSLPASVAALRMPSVVETDGSGESAKLAPSLANRSGRVQVVVQLSLPPASATAAATAAGVNASSADASAAVAAIQAQQAQLIASVQRVDSAAQVLGSVSKALNAVMLDVDAGVARQLAKSPVVKSVRPVINYESDLSETVPYIGATAVQQAGFTGKGVRVAVLDSGIDYTHAALSGPGTLEAYEAAYGTSPADPRNTTRDGLFPTPKVVEGYDFVGEAWPNGPLAPDPDPIDLEGHGTHVSDIIGGLKGVAPDVSFYAVKVCSAVATSCSGVALLQGMDYAVDPNGDNDFSDHVDIVNMSLGQSYGMAYDDDLSLAVENASAINVLTVASAGNSADKPFIVGTPSAAPSALSVAQTEVPSSFLQVLKVLAPASIAGDIGATFQPFAAPLTAALEGPVQYGDTAGGNRLGCAAFPAGSLAGKILLVDRGTCSISIKVSNGAAAGALAVVVGLVAPGDPTVFSFGGGNPSVPGYNIRQSDATKIKTGLSAGVTMRIDPANQLPLVKHVVGSSSRGPSMLTHIIKPEIGAPGASVSAIAGTGNETEAFGGTSGAAPMVTGAAALIKQAYPTRSNAEIKAVLVNTGETDIMNKAALLGGYLAPITRIGGGEVRVDRALKSSAAAWTSGQQPVISLGFNDWSRTNLLTRVGVTVRNYSNVGKTYKVTYNFRYPNDQALNALKISAPNQVFASANSAGSFGVNFTLKTENLLDWNNNAPNNAPNSGANGANADALTLYELDGYVTLTNVADPNDTIHLPWQMLPRKAGEVSLDWKRGYVQTRNRGVGATSVEAYSMLGGNGDLPRGGPGENNPTPDFRYVGYATFLAPAGTCSANDSFILGFAVNTFERQTHANYPLSIEVDLDTNQDGTFDYAVYTSEVGAFAADGRNAVFALNLATGQAQAFFFTDHQMNSSNTVMYICAEQIGMKLADVGKPMDVAFLAVDNYFTGLVTDVIDGITISALGEQFGALFDNGGFGATTLAANAQDKLRILDFGATTNNTENGLLLLYRNGAIPWVEAAALFTK